ncbi:MAG: DUF4397 domain-containing protein [Steroidobacteraceae bacterium]|nr:DUF4397 domain-containing protein [Steroidobacteraceae bacterium]
MQHDVQLMKPLDTDDFFRHAALAATHGRRMLARLTAAVILVPLLFLLLLLSACDGGGGDSPAAQVRLLNVSSGYDSLDMYVNNDNDDADSDQLQVQAVAFGALSDYASLDPDTYSLKFRRNGVSSTLRTLSGQQLAEDTHATYVASGSSGRFLIQRIDEDVTEPDAGYTRVNVVNAAEAGSIDVYLTDPGVALDDATPELSGIVYGGSSDTTLDSGTYRLRITGAGDSNDIRLDIPELELGSAQVLSIVLTATPGGVLVNAILLPQQGSITTYANTKARVRAAAAVANGTTVGVSMGGVKLLSSTITGVIGTRYEQVEAGTVSVSANVDGVPVTVPNQTLQAGVDYTFLVYSDASGTRTVLFQDDNRVPSSDSRTKIRVMNGLSAMAVPITLSLDFFPVSEAIAVGQVSPYSEVDPGADYQLDVYNSNTAENLHSRDDVDLAAAGVYTLFVYESGGGVKSTLRKDR